MTLSLRIRRALTLAILIGYGFWANVDWDSCEGHSASTSEVRR